MKRKRNRGKKYRGDKIDENKRRNVKAEKEVQEDKMKMQKQIQRKEKRRKIR